VTFDSVESVRRHLLSRTSCAGLWYAFEVGNCSGTLPDTHQLTLLNLGEQLIEEGYGRKASFIFPYFCIFRLWLHHATQSQKRHNRLISQWIEPEGKYQQLRIGSGLNQIFQLGIALKLHAPSELEENSMTPLLRILALMRDGNWDEAHNLVQRDDSISAAWLHGLLHVQEGDLENAEYWYGRARRNFHERGSLSEELDALEASLRGPET